MYRIKNRIVKIINVYTTWKITIYKCKTNTLIIKKWGKLEINEKLTGCEIVH